MKKLLFVAAALLMSQMASADKILTRANETIEGKVTKVDAENIEYTRNDNPGGPVYILPKSKVVMVHYDNGQIETFSASGSSSVEGKSATVAAQPKETPIYTREAAMDRCADLAKGVTCDNNGHFVRSTNGSSPVVLSSDETYQLMNCFDERFGKRYKRYGVMRTSGIILTAAGTCALGGGIAMLVKGYNDEEDDTSDDFDDDAGDNLGLMLGGYCVAVVGVGMVGTGIPLWVIGHNKQHRQVKDFSRTYFGSVGYEDNQKIEPCSLSFKSSKHGLGLAFTF